MGQRKLYLLDQKWFVVKIGTNMACCVIAVA